eukprot:CAMPEP_0172928352 /NCGR_PEP_ID=MMETSP1075-20121228/217932_1 /TAXON_ID=2916 /ORGANISM="Ceratium fusus, Strain PA161109" /LENGTH=288 /DNA_ID=CAMNT_0013789637 /DNA_START=74 /DNA_END=938 /DNA_ORIENTATION=-
MGRVILGSRKGKSLIFTAKTRLRKGAVKLRATDYLERHGYIKGLIKKVEHEPARGAPVCEVVFHDPYRYKLKKELFVAVEGAHTGQFVYCGSKAQLSIGNVLPLGKMPEGTIISMCEEKAMDRGKLARASGTSCMVVGHSDFWTLRVLSRGGKDNGTRHPWQPQGQELDFHGQNKLRKGAVKLRATDYLERHGYIKGLIKKVEHEPARGAPVCEVVFHDPYRYKLKKELWVAVEGAHTGQFVYCGSKAQLAIGNVLPLGKMPEGTIISMCEEKAMDRGKLARASGTSC